MNTTTPKREAWILLACDCGNRDSTPPPLRTLPPCSAGCGRTMFVIGVEP